MELVVLLQVNVQSILTLRLTLHRIYIMYLFTNYCHHFIYMGCPENDAVLSKGYDSVIKIIYSSTSIINEATYRYNGWTVHVNILLLCLQQYT